MVISYKRTSSNSCCLLAERARITNAVTKPINFVSLFALWSLVCCLLVCFQHRLHVFRLLTAFLETTSKDLLLSNLFIFFTQESYRGLRADHSFHLMKPLAIAINIYNINGIHSYICASFIFFFFSSFFFMKYFLQITKEDKITVCIAMTINHFLFFFFSSLKYGLHEHSQLNTD